MRSSLLGVVPALAAMLPVAAQDAPPAVRVPIALAHDVAPGPATVSVSWTPELESLVAAGVAAGPGGLEVELERRGEQVLMHGISPKRLDAGQHTLTLRPKTEWQTPFRFETTDEGVSLLLNDQPIWSSQRIYDTERYEETYKVYHHVHSPVDGMPITKGAGGAFPHHRGIYCGWNKTRVQGAKRAWDFWHFQKGIHQRYVCTVHRHAGPVRASIQIALEWVTGEGESVVLESRTLTAWKTPGRAWLEVATTLRPTGEQPVELRGDPQHAGLQFRAANEVNDSERKAHYRRPGSAHGGNNDVWHDCPWVVADFAVRGEHYEVLHASHPDNESPFVYSTRNYGRFGSFQEFDLEPGKPCTLRYLIVMSPTKPGEQVIDAAAAYREFAGN